MGSAAPHWALAGSSPQLSLASVGKTGLSQLRGAHGLSQTVTQQNAAAWFALGMLIASQAAVSPLGDQDLLCNPRGKRS